MLRASAAQGMAGGAIIVDAAADVYGTAPHLFDDLVGACEDRLRHGEAEGLGRFEVHR